MTPKKMVVYVPLFTQPEWEGMPYMTYRSVEDFNATFEWVDERIP